MYGGKTADVALFIDGNQQYVWRCVLNHEFIPLFSGEHRFASEFPEIRPGFANGSIEHRTDLLGILWNGPSNRGHTLTTVARALDDHHGLATPSHIPPGSETPDD